MNIFDAHCDTLYELSKNGTGLLENGLNIDLKRMARLGKYSQFFAAWIEDEESAWDKFNKMSDIFEAEMEKNKDIVMKCLCYEDLKKAHNENKIAAFLTLEGAYMAENVSDIDNLYNKGVRCAALTWNGDNNIAGGVDSQKGLSAAGTEFIERMEEIGMIVDVSHLNERSFWDIAKICKKPFIASHSNSYAVCPHKRNLTDGQFLAICRAGGCVGINFYSLFLNNEGLAFAGDIVRHIKHFIELGGEEHIGLGSDFDGVDALPEEIKGVQDMPEVAEVLERAGLTGRQIDKIMHLNFERIIKECL